MFRTAAATLLTLALAAPAAMAETATVSEPLAGASLQSSGTALSVYYTETTGDDFEIVAFYTDADAPRDPARLVLQLSDGERARITLPGAPEARFSIVRSGDMVQVTDEAGAQDSLG
ncbi:hypothetical protein QO034_12525 [Sedimentitalea sp. JM2-8]|uniref:Uncharacterized protein n=1 Tax=Sedimentitalea xiamensis TaxID=3050037 RepID=A0ABT7FFL9_9RHOB|nr:hypothetical protein [Sedimentitalea xiamensis]MDK3073939.1 hypothetical protein [Sedimentitalea xiamensis]